MLERWLIVRRLATNNLQHESWHLSTLCFSASWIHSAFVQFSTSASFRRNLWCLFCSYDCFCLTPFWKSSSPEQGSQGARSLTYSTFNQVSQFITPACRCFLGEKKAAWNLMPLKSSRSCFARLGGRCPLTGTVRLPRFSHLMCHLRGLCLSALVNSKQN